MQSVKNVIIGAGPTGIGAAFRLKELGHSDFVVIDRNAYAGGLSASFRDESGYTWDVGGHVLFSHYKYFDQLMASALPDDMWLAHQREAWAQVENRWVPYPMQSNIRYLSKETMWKCLEGMFDTCVPENTCRKPANFKEWLIASFGAGMAERILIPYNMKVWAYPLDKLSYQWIGDRVATIDLKRTIRNIVMQLDDVSWGPNATFRFPRRGGTGAIWRNLAKSIGHAHFLFDSEMTGLDTSKRVVSLSDGRQISYERLLSTIPLNLLCPMITPALPCPVLDAASSLDYTSVHVIGLGLRGKPPEALSTKRWMYFPENNCPFYRVTVFSNYSPENVPDISRGWSLLTETSESPHKPVDESIIVEETIRGCLATNLISSRADIVNVWKLRVEHSYPLPTLGRNAALDVILPALEDVGVQARGRFGAWRYEIGNQDHSVIQGMEWADRAALGKAEETVFADDPNTDRSGTR